ELGLYTVLQKLALSGSCGGLLDERSIVVLRLVDAQADAMRGHARRVIRLYVMHELSYVLVCGIEPCAVVLRPNDDRHAVMKRPHQVVRFSRDKRDAPQSLPVRRNAGEREELGVARLDVPGELAAPERLPFVEAARRHEAAPLAEGVAKGRPLGERLAARIG